MKNDMLKPSQIEKKYKIKARTLKYWRTRNNGPPYERIGRWVYYNERDFIAWIRRVIASQTLREQFDVVVRNWVNTYRNKLDAIEKELKNGS